MIYASSGVGQPILASKGLRPMIPGPIGTPGYSELLAPNTGMK